jgi:type II restriction enzyme
MKRDFDAWLQTMKTNLASWNFYTNFRKVYQNVDTIKVELNILNSLIGSQNIESDFVGLINKYPDTIKVIPILLAKREHEMHIMEIGKDILYDFSNFSNHTTDEYFAFMKNTGLFDLLQHHIINNLVDYVLGIEVGMDTNGRKNRTGHVMEDLVEDHLIKCGFEKNISYFKEMTKSNIESNFHIDLSSISNRGKTEKRFDFVFIIDNHVYACECNFYGSNGSKLNETARSYKTIAIESRGIDRFSFIWITDGAGWLSAKHNLEETFDNLDHLYNLNDLKNGSIKKLLHKD